MEYVVTTSELQSVECKEYSQYSVITSVKRTGHTSSGEEGRRQQDEAADQGGDR